MDNRRHRRRHSGPSGPATIGVAPANRLVPAWPPGEASHGADSEHTIAELIALVRETGGMVGGHGLWDPRHENDVRRMLTTALEMEGVLPPGKRRELRSDAG